MKSNYNNKWFDTATIEELQIERKKVQTDYRNPNLDLEYRWKMKDLLHKFDVTIGRRQGSGRDYKYPVHSENGYYLRSDD